MGDVLGVMERRQRIGIIMNNDWALKRSEKR